MTDLAQAVMGGLLGGVLLTTILRGASEAGLTRMDIPFLLGTMLSRRRRAAKAIGYLLHAGFAVLFALAYLAVFGAVGMASWWLGAVLGVVHAVFIMTVLVNVVVPLLHPLMGDSFTDARRSPLIEPPGFLLRNYGASTPLVALVAHVVYGATVGIVVAQ